MCTQYYVLDVYGLLLQLPLALVLEPMLKVATPERICIYHSAILRVSHTSQKYMVEIKILQAHKNRKIVVLT